MKNKKYIKIRKKLRLLAIKAILFFRVSEKKIVILSSPRSGSTWLGNVLSAVPNSCVLFEPLHLVHVPESKQAGFTWRTYLPVSSKWNKGRAFLKRVFKGQVINEWTSREMSFRQAKKAEMMIVKFVRASRLIPWICKEFEVRATILLIRHPCAVLASQMKSKDWSNAKRPGLPAYLEEFPQFQNVISNTQGTEEHLAAIWALDQLPPFLESQPHPWIFITYEELYLRPGETIEKIRQTCGLPIDSKLAMTKISKKSSVTYKSGISGISGWKEQFSKSQVDRILKTIHALGLSFYTEEIEPDYDLLNSARLAEKIRETGRTILNGYDAPSKNTLPPHDAIDEHHGDFVAVSGSIIPSPDRRWCGPEFKDDQWYIQSSEHEAMRLIDHFQCNLKTRVLDVGCGQGRLPIGILRKIGDLHYQGIDIDQWSINWCKRYIERDHSSFVFKHLNIYNERYNKHGEKIDNSFRLDIASKSFDIIYLFSVFSHTTEEDMEVYLKEFYRILDENGKIFFTTFVEEGVPDFSINPDGYRLDCSGPLHIVRYNKDYLLSILDDCGFSLQSFTYATEADGQSALYLKKKN